MDATTFQTKPKYISGKNITEYVNKPMTVIGTVCESAKEGEDKKLMLCFDLTDIKLVLNQTNLKTMINNFGGNTDSWRFKEIKLLSIPTKFNGTDIHSVIIVV